MKYSELIFIKPLLMAIMLFTPFFQFRIIFQPEFFIAKPNNIISRKFAIYNGIMQVQGFFSSILALITSIKDPIIFLVQHVHCIGLRIITGFYCYKLQLTFLQYLKNIKTNRIAVTLGQIRSNMLIQRFIFSEHLSLQ